MTDRWPDTFVQRWEHWACERGKADVWLAERGWTRVPSGQTLSSGNIAFKYVRE